MNKLDVLIYFLKNYKPILFKVLLYELFYSLKYLEFPFYYMKIHKNSKFATDSIPCLYYYLHEIAKFINKRKIKKITDLGSGFGRVTNFLSNETKAKIIGIEFDKEVFNKANIIKAKNVNLINKNFLKLNLKKHKSECFIMVDPLKYSKDTIKIQKKIIDANKQKKGPLYLIMINVDDKLINKKFKKIKSKPQKNCKKRSIFFYYC